MEEKKTVKKYTLKEKIMAIGPGALITASFIGPGTVTTCTRAGADYGYALLWTVVLQLLQLWFCRKCLHDLALLHKWDWAKQ